MLAFLLAAGGRPHLGLHGPRVLDDGSHGRVPRLRVDQPQRLLQRGGRKGDVHLSAATRSVVPDLGTDYHGVIRRPAKRMSGQPNTPIEDFTVDDFSLLRDDFGCALRVGSFGSRDSFSLV